jgi:hypothetical protein
VEIATLQHNVTTDLAQIVALTGEIQTLQNELNAKKNYVAPAWYDTIGTVGIAVLVAICALVVGVGAYFGGRRTGHKTGSSDPSRGATTSSFGSVTLPPPVTFRSPETVVNRTMAAVAVLENEGRLDEARHLRELANTLARGSHADSGRPEIDTMYR